MSILPLPVIVAQLTKINGCSEDLARAFLVDFADLVGAALADQGFCEVKGIGVFRKIEAGGTVTVEFGPDPSLAEAVNLPFSMFEPVELDDEVTEDMLEAAAEEAETSVMEPLTAAKRDDAPADMAVLSEVDEETSDVDASEVGNTADAEPQTEESEEVHHVTETPVRETVVEDTVVEETPQPELAPVHEPSRQAPSQSRPGVRQVPRSLNEKIAEQRREAPAVTYERVIEKERVVENNHHTMNIVLTAFLALMAGLLIGFFAYDRLNLSAVKSVNISAEDVQVYHAASDVPAAKAEPTEVDSTLMKTGPQPSAAVAETVPETPEASVATPGVVTDTVRAGRFLTTMAQKHYGKKKFWVYIYMENIDKLGDPDLIPPMTTVVIPPASKYGIKPGDRASEEAAERKAAEIMSRFSKN